MACALLHLIAKELEALANMDDPRLLRVQFHSQGLPEASLGNGQRPLSVLPRLTQHHEVVRPARKPEAFRRHLAVKRCQENVGPQRTGHPSVGHPGQCGLPAPSLHHARPQHVAHALEDSAVTDRLGDQVDALLLVDGVEERAQIRLDDPDVPRI